MSKGDWNLVHAIIFKKLEFDICISYFKICNVNLSNVSINIVTTLGWDLFFHDYPYIVSLRL